MLALLRYPSISGRMHGEPTRSVLLKDLARGFLVVRFLRLPPMPINLSVPQIGGTRLTVPIENGQCIFVLGANGTGKSSLMHAFYAAHHASTRRISAHR